MPAPTIGELRNKLWGGTNPFSTGLSRLIAQDLQGWGSEHEYLSATVEQLRPRIVVEVGVWKGGSTVTMAHKLKELGIDGAVIAVDTWLGAWDHWLNPQLRDELCFINGYPHIYEKFAANIVHQGLQDYVVPLPLDSTNARNVVSGHQIAVDLIHIDGGHDYPAVMNDLIQWWSTLRPGGYLIADDYYEEGVHWPGVFKAVSDFLAMTPHEGFEFQGGKCRVRKI